MDKSDTRGLIGQLSDDLSWLEQHCRQQPDQASHAGKLRLGAALVRNLIGPFLDGQAPTPLHVTVVGGAGAGKSTVVNLLTGSTTAEANPQAGFTRHPIAYTNANGLVTWPAHLGFLGPLQRLTEPAPANLDRDVYQVRRISADSHSASLLQNFTVWDCPDMTTWAAAGYVPRLLEICGLADVLVYVASDERYNDEVPTQFLRLLLEAGKPVVVAIMKMREADAQAFLEHFKSAVLSKLPGGAINLLAIPFLSAEELATPTSRAAKYRIPLLNQVAVLGDPAAIARKRSVRLATNYLVAESERLLSAARNDLTALHSWRTMVQSAQIEFDSRYRHEYLETHKFRRFDEALVRLLELLDLPGIGQFVSNALWVMRTPYRLVKGWLGKALRRPDSIQQPELPVLEAALAGWLDMLRKEAVRQTGKHPLWAYIEKGFESDLTEMARDKFREGFQNFQMGMSDEVDRTARAIYEDLEKNPMLLNTLRGGKFAMDIAAIGVTLATGTIGAQDLILVPLAASVSHQLVEWLGAQYVDNQREHARNRQQAMVTQYISKPLADWLIAWPTSGGSAYERLQLALKRIPPGIQKLDAAVTEKIKDEG